MLLYKYITIVSPVSAHGRLNITCDSCPYERLPGVCIAHICIEAAILTPWNAVYGRLPGSGCGVTRYYPMCIVKWWVWQFSFSQLKSAPILRWRAWWIVDGFWFSHRSYVSLLCSLSLSLLLYVYIMWLHFSLYHLCIGHMVVIYCPIQSRLYYITVGTGIGYRAKCFI